MFSESSMMSGGNSLSPEKGQGHVLDNYFNEIATPENVFCFDKTMKTKDLETRMQELEVLLAKLENASSAERAKIQAEDPLICAIPDFSADVTSYLEDKALDSSVQVKEGAENKSYIYYDDGAKRVIKVSKERHDYDLISVVKLMRNMYALELFERNQDSFMSFEEGDISIDVVFDQIIIAKDDQGRYKRIITQPFVEAGSIKEEMASQNAETVEFRQAWKKFLEQIGLLQATAEVALDITDSSQGGKPSRGNVALTENVKVEEGDKDGQYIFRIIDLDVFDDPLMDTKKNNGEQHKFYASEQLRNRGSVIGAIKVFVTNMARERYVKPMQDIYTKKELDK